MKRLVALSAGLLLFSSSAGNAQTTAARACVHTPTIAAAADFLLTEPQNPPRFWRDNYGDDAAYLKIHYADLSYAQGLALIETLEKRRASPRRILELKLTYARPDERAAMIASLPAEPADRTSGSALPRLGVSTWRALIVADGGVWFFPELSRWRMANAAAFNQNIAVMERRLAPALDDLSDQDKSEIARQFEHAGAWRTALLILQRRAELGEFLQLLDRQSGLDQATRDSFILAATGWGRSQPLESARQPAEIQRAMQNRRSFWSLMGPLIAAVRLAPETQILMTVTNQIGEMRISTELAARLAADIGAGRIDAVNEPDKVLAAIVDGLDLLIGRPVRESQLRSFSAGRPWGQDETAADVADKALARIALGPFVRGAVADGPARPAAVSDALPWDRWVATASDLRANRPIGDENRMIGAELLVAADRNAEALRHLQSAPDWQAARQRAYGMLVALDRRCAHRLSHPAPFEEPLYRFGPR